MNATAVVRPDWGHPIVTPDGREIRVPNWAMQELRKANFLVENTAELKHAIYAAVTGKLRNLISQDLYQILGPDLSGPGTVKCSCRSCQKKHSDVDDTPLPRSHPVSRAKSRAIADRVVREVKAKRVAA